jgi:hypothetical protein
MEIKILRLEDAAILFAGGPDVYDDAVNLRVTTEFLNDPRHHLVAAIEPWRGRGGLHRLSTTFTRTNVHMKCGSMKSSGACPSRARRGKGYPAFASDHLPPRYLNAALNEISPDSEPALATRLAQGMPNMA